jgi:hypothetical protein
MSPAKAGKSSNAGKSSKSVKKSKPKVLTIEFAGIATFVWDKKRGSAEVHLVDLASAGFERHYAALSFEVTESTPHGIKGPSADAAVSLLGQNVDVGVWNLLGTTVELFGATGKLTVDDVKVDVTKKPPKSAQSIRWMADVGSLCESNAINPLCPTAAVIRLPAGHVTSTGAGAARKVEFTSDGTPIGPDRYCLPRFTVAVPFETEIAMRLSRERILRFNESMAVTISNTCVCGLGVGPVANHFYGHYDVVNAKRRPKVQPAGPQPMTPLFPELCWTGFVEMM